MVDFALADNGIAKYMQFGWFDFCYNLKKC